MRKKRLTQEIRRIKHVACIVLVLAAHVLGILVVVPQQKVAAEVELNFTELGTHPQAASQATSTGKTLNKLQLFGGKLFAAYGDYNANTGPISINPYDIANGSFDGEAIQVFAESLGNWKVIDNKLYTTTIDATCSGSCPSGYAAGDANGTWQVNTPVNAEHIFDIATLTGTDIWLFGGSGDTAYVWRSTDAGQNWIVVQTNNVNPGDGDDSERYYWGQAMDGKMYMQADVFGNTQAVQIYYGTNWTSGTTDIICGRGTSAGGPNPVVFDHKIVCAENNEIRIFDGEQTNTISIDDQGYCGVSDWGIYEDAVYVLCRNGSTIRRTKDLSHWQTFEGIPVSATSFTIDSDTGKLYVGGDDSKLCVSNFEIIDTTTPTITITSPATMSSGTSFDITVSTNDNVATTKVEYYVDNVLVGTSTEAPYTFKWTNLYGVNDWEIPSGQHNLTTKAFDFDGNSAVSAPVPVVVEEPDIIVQPYLNDSLSSASVMARDPHGDIWYNDIAPFLGGDAPLRFAKINVATGEKTFYNLPEEETHGFMSEGSMAVNASGVIWYLECDNEEVVSFDTVTSEVVHYEGLEVCQDGAGFLVPADDGTVLTTASSGSTLYSIDANGTVDTIDLPANAGVSTLSKAADGRVVVALVIEGDPAEAMLATVDPGTGLDIYYASDADDPLAFVTGQSMTIDSDGTSWVAGYDQNEGVALLSRVSDEGIVTQYSLSDRVITQLTPDSNGNIWAGLLNGLVVKITPSTGQIGYYNLLTPYSSDVFGEDTDEINRTILGYLGLSMAPDLEGNLWVGDGAGNRFLRVTAKTADQGDELQNQATLTNPETGKTILLTTPGTTSITCASTIKESGLTKQDAAYDYPLGLVNFCFTTEQIKNQVRLTFETDLKPNQVTARKYNTVMNTYTNIPEATITETTIDGKHALQVEYSIDDNSLLDLDPDNGEIADPMGLGVNIVGAPNTGFKKH